MEKINIEEILKDCPSGMELDCTMYDNVQLDTVQGGNVYPIKINTPEGRISLSKYGCYSLNPQCKCVIFPKGKTTWEGFHKPFNDGDVITCTNSGCTFVAIYNRMVSEDSFYRYACLILDDKTQVSLNGAHSDFTNPRYATEEEKQKLFDAIKANGYKWNAETKTLEKLEVKKFDITTLKPFDKVLVRQNNYDTWHIGFFEKYDKSLGGYPFVCMYYSKYAQCIPYEENKHLSGTTNDCDDYFKTWE